MENICLIFTEKKKNRKSSGELGIRLVRAPTSPEILPSLPLYYKLWVCCLCLAFYIGGGDLNSVPHTYCGKYLYP